MAKIACAPQVNASWVKRFKKFKNSFRNTYLRLKVIPTAKTVLFICLVNYVHFSVKKSIKLKIYFRKINADRIKLLDVFQYVYFIITLLHRIGKNFCT